MSVTSLRRPNPNGTDSSSSIRPLRAASLVVLCAAWLAACDSDAPPADGGADGRPVTAIPSAGLGDAGGDVVPDRTAPVSDAPDPAGMPRIDVRVPFVDPGAAPAINGSFGLLWAPAAADDVDGEPLAIDRLLVGKVGGAAGALPGYRWYALHDAQSLYLFVTFDRTGERAPSGDSEALFDDDTLNLYVDGDHSRSATLDDSDRYLAIPARTADGGEPPPVVAPAVLAPFVPPSLKYGFCLCAGRIGGWEVKIPLAELGITVGQPFGFEVQVDQDVDGGSRDARWGWSHPSLGERDERYRADSPAFNGTLLLSAPE